MMMAGPLEYRHIDIMIDAALNGDMISFPMDEDVLDRVRELATNPGSHDPEELRQEGYQEVDRQAEIHRLAELRRSLATA